MSRALTSARMGLSLGSRGGGQGLGAGRKMGGGGPVEAAAAPRGLPGEGAAPPGSEAESGPSQKLSESVSAASPAPSPEGEPALPSGGRPHSARGGATEKARALPWVAGPRASLGRWGPQAPGAPVTPLRAQCPRLPSTLARVGGGGSRAQGGAARAAQAQAPQHVGATHPKPLAPRETQGPFAPAGLPGKAGGHPGLSGGTRSGPLGGWGLIPSPGHPRGLRPALGCCDSPGPGTATSSSWPAATGLSRVPAPHLPEMAPWFRNGSLPLVICILRVRSFALCKSLDRNR